MIMIHIFSGGVHEGGFILRCCLAVGDIFNSFPWLLMMLHIFYSTTNISLRHMLVVLFQAIYVKTIRPHHSNQWYITV